MEVMITWFLRSG